MWLKPIASLGISIFSRRRVCRSNSLPVAKPFICVIFWIPTLSAMRMSLATPEHLRAALEIYRAFSANEKFNSAQQSAISVPLVLAPGKNSPFEKLMPSFADALRTHGCANVEIEVIENSAHFVTDEQPDAVAQLIERHASL